EVMRWWETVDEVYLRYHDEEWGRPVRDERGIYERLCLEGFQSGLSGLTILRKRPAFREAFAGFDPERVAAFREADVDRLLADAGIVRHRGKIEAAIANAHATVTLRDAGEPLHELFWSHVVSDGPAPVSAADWRAATPPAGWLAERPRGAGLPFLRPAPRHRAPQALRGANRPPPGCVPRGRRA